MAVNKVEICGVNTAKLPLLSNEEKDELFSRIVKGDSEARRIFIEGNLRLVLSIIKRFSSSNENVDDLFQIGCIGLIKAIDNSIRVSRSLRDTAYKAIYAKEHMMKEQLREPTIHEIAEEIGISKEDIVMALDAIQSPVSLYEPVYTEGGDTLYVMDQISDKKNKEESWVEDLSLSEAVKRLNDREANIIRLRYFEGKTQMEVAKDVGISQAQVSRLEKNALKSMRQYLEG